MTSVSRGIDRIEVIFDDPHLVANAGLLLVATLARTHPPGRLGGERPRRWRGDFGLIRPGSDGGFGLHRVWWSQDVGLILEAPIDRLI